MDRLESLRLAAVRLDRALSDQLSLEWALDEAKRKVAKARADYAEALDAANTRV